jgi:hypothetical protein
LPQNLEIQHPRHSSSTNLCVVPFALNGQPLTIDHANSDATTHLQIPAGDWIVDLAIQTFCAPTGQDSLSAQRAFFFNVTGIDQIPLDTPPTFTVVIGQSEKPQILIESAAKDESNCASALASVVDETSSIFSQIEAIPTNNDIKSSSDIDTVEQLLRRRLYEQATKLQKLNQTCRKSTGEKLADCHHDISCIARVMCQRIHDTTLTKLKEVQASLQDSVMISKHRQHQYVVVEHDDDDDWDFDVTSVDGLLSGLDKDNSVKDNLNPQHPVVLALEILAAAFGLTALCAFLSRRFCSLRRRVERAADKEERRRARHFRCLARREALRKKWVSFKQVFKKETRNGDYDEKRALVIEAADYAETCFHQSGDAEMGQAISGLCNAQQFVAGLVHHHRLRKSSTAGSGTTTLPDYTEEKLPDYTSSPGSGRYTPSLGSMNTAITPDSSIILTPRCSRETLRTGIDFDSD